MRSVIIGALLSLVCMTSAQACDYCINGRQAFRATTPVLVEGMGRHHHRVSTTNEEAQCFFDQGLTFCFAFNHDEAVRSFRHAAALDTTLAMAYWGVAHALGTNYNIPVDSVREFEAFQAIQKALSLEQYASPAERGYIRAMAARYTGDPNPNYAALDSAYMLEMKALHEKYPDDRDLATLYAESIMNLRPWALWELDGTAAPGTEEIVSVLESVLRRNPDHAGAAHLYIHAVEASPRPERALTAAYRLGALVPASGHLVHMPGHAFIRLGLYQESIKANHLAVSLDSAYVAAGGGSGFYGLLYYPHNIHFLSVSYAMDGQFAPALRYAEMLDEVAGSKYILDPHIEGIGPTKTYILAKFHQWNAILAEPAPDPNLKVLTAVWHWGRGMAHASKGEVKKAKRELAEFEKAKGQFTGTEYMGVINLARDVAPIPALVLQAQIAVAEKRPEDAVKYLYEAAGVQDGLAYEEPEAWIISAREPLGALLLKLDRADEAERVFREDLAKYPLNGRSLFGLSQALEQQGKTHEAALVRQDFSRAWSRSDVTLAMEEL